MEFHANLLEEWDVLQNHSVALNILVNFTILTSLLLENEQLIGLLLVHDQDLSRNNSKIFLILTLGHCNNLIGLSGVSLEKLDWHLV